MKQLLFVLPLLVIASPVYAAPTYLTCKDTTHTETKITTSDKSEEVETKSDPGVYKVFLNLDQNQVAVDGGPDCRLEVEPATISLTKSSYEEKPEDSRGNRTSSIRNTIFLINRATLAYERTSSSLYRSTTNNRKAFRTSLLIMQQAGVPFFLHLKLNETPNRLVYVSRHWLPQIIKSEDRFVFSA